MSPLHSLLRSTGRLVGENKLSILIYHQVLPAPDPMRPGEPDVEKFRWHMQLLRHYFNPMPLGEAVQRLQQEELPANTVCVTFDDGYKNNLTVAQPVLRELGIPATVFVATAFCHGRNMWNDRLIDLVGNMQLSQLNLETLGMATEALAGPQSRLQLVEKLIPSLKYQGYRERLQIIDELYRTNGVEEAAHKMLTHNEVLRLSQRGVCIGAHTVDHPILKNLSPTEQREQIAGSKYTLENLIGKPVDGFAYPNGRPGTDYDDLSIQMVREAGFNHAVSTTWGISTVETSPFELNRSTPWDQNEARFHLRMLRNVLAA